MSDKIRSAEPSSAEVWAARVGERVVVRHRLASGQLTDAVGTLEAVDGAGLRITTPHGGSLVALGDVVAGKVVPPRPSRPAPPHLGLSLGDLERLTARHWSAREQEPLGAWLLRASDGFTGRANSVLVQGDPGMPVPQALDTVRSWYAARGLPPLASVAVPADATAAVAGQPLTPFISGALTAQPHVDGAAQLELRAGLDRMGWRPGGGISAYCLTAPVAAARVGPGAEAALKSLRDNASGNETLRLVVTDEPDEQWLATYKYRGNDSPAAAGHLLTSAPQQAFFSIRTTVAAGTQAGSAQSGSAQSESAQSGSAQAGSTQTVAVARGSLAGGWGCVTAVDVAAAYRRRGLATVLLRAIADWAAQRGASSLFLQVAAANEPAQRMYLAAGFVVHHRYDYLVPGEAR